MTPVYNNYAVEFVDEYRNNYFERELSKHLYAICATSSDESQELITPTEALQNKQLNSYSQR